MSFSIYTIYIDEEWSVHKKPQDTYSVFHNCGDNDNYLHYISQANRGFPRSFTCNCKKELPERAYTYMRLLDEPIDNTFMVFAYSGNEARWI